MDSDGVIYSASGLPPGLICSAGSCGVVDLRECTVGKDGDIIPATIVLVEQGQSEPLTFQAELPPGVSF
jgi:hypothetical protein